MNPIKVLGFSVLAVSGVGVESAAIGVRSSAVTGNVERIEASAVRTVSGQVEDVGVSPADGMYDAVKAQRGLVLFTRSCAGCHVKATRTGNTRRIVLASSGAGNSGANVVPATRAAAHFTRLRDLWRHPPYLEDGHAETLAEVVEHYDASLTLGLTVSERGDLVEYLKSR